MKKLILIDFSWLYNKYYHVAEYSVLKEKGEAFKNILRNNLLKMLTQFLELAQKSYHEDRFIVALDSPTSSLNNYKLFEGYKQNRNKEEKKEVYSYLEEILKKLIRHLNSKSFAFVKAKGYEADQILACMAKKYYEKYEIIIFSGDKDMLQLTSFPNIYVSEKFEKGAFIIKTEEEIFQKFKNYKGESFTRISRNKSDILKYRTLKGDVSDNLSSVYPRIKDKEIINIIKNYWTTDEELTEEIIEVVLNKIRENDVALADKLTYNKENWLRNYKIMDLCHIENIKIKRLKC